MRSVIIFFGCFVYALCSSLLAAGEWRVVSSENVDLVLLYDEVPVGSIANRMVAGPRWTPAGLDAAPRIAAGKRIVKQDLLFNPGHGEALVGGPVGFTHEVEQVGPRTLRLTLSVSASVPVSYRFPHHEVRNTISGGPYLVPGAFFTDGTIRCTWQDGGGEDFPVPFPRGQHADLAALSCIATGGEEVRFSFDPPVYFHRDGEELRFMFQQEGEQPAGETFVQRIDVTFPGPLTFEAENRWVRTEDWYPLTIDNDLDGPSAISMDDWQHKPAGIHGPLLMKGERYEFEDGTSGVFWGVNTINHGIDREGFDRWARYLSKYGYNLARMVAFARPNYERIWSHYLRLQDVNDGSRFDAEALDLFDYGFNAMKQEGIYVGLSPFYGFFPTPADDKRLIAADELRAVIHRGMPMDGTFYNMVCFAPDLQQLVIDWHVRLLEHKNPYTGLRYADDPALIFYELHNEENGWLQYPQIAQKIKQCPTYHRLLRERFADWLRARYGDQAGLAKAWHQHLKGDESLDEATVEVIPGWFRTAGITVRIADQLAFWHDEQSAYYQKFVDAVRKTGYRGGLSGSCWQSSTWQGHLYNVLSDAEVGQIDRHNYASCDFDRPGAGLISAGFQAVADRPFSYSEWHGYGGIGMKPDVVMVAAYGMGLQGWDLSMQFACGDSYVFPYDVHGINQIVNNFGIVSQNPVLARMVRRGDISQGKVVAKRRVSVPALRETGKVGFEEAFSLLGRANNKFFAAAVPQESLAAGRVLLEFVDGPVKQPVVDETGPYIDTENKTVRSSTGELVWDYADRGHFTINTAGTQGAAGFIAGETIDLSRVRINCDTEYAHILVTACGAGETLADAERLLISAHARFIDEGTRFDVFGSTPVTKVKQGQGKLLIEPVEATVLLRDERPCRVIALDHDGRIPTQPKRLQVQQVPEGQLISIDGRRLQTPYILVEFDQR